MFVRLSLVSLTWLGVHCVQTKLTWTPQLNWTEDCFQQNHHLGTEKDGTGHHIVKPNKSTNTLP